MSHWTDGSTPEQRPTTAKSRVDCCSGAPDYTYLVHKIVCATIHNYNLRQEPYTQCAPQYTTTTTHRSHIHCAHQPFQYIILDHCEIAGQLPNTTHIYNHTQELYTLYVTVPPM